MLFQHYLVVYLDILGQREVLRKIIEIPTNKTEELKFIETIKESVGRVLNMQKFFKQYYESDRSYKPNVNLVSDENQSEFLAIQKKPDVVYSGFSDAIVIAVPLMNNDENSDENCTAVNGVYSAFVAIGGINLLFLSRRIALRAGLDVGVATRIDDNQIYGPALERAYTLESNWAEYPRFLIGEELINYLTWVKNQQYINNIGKVVKEIAKYCLEMITQDTDGRYMLDFLGIRAKAEMGRSFDQNMVVSAYEFVKSQSSKYLKSEDEKLASRYYRLLQYFHSRMSVWG